ncbi:pep-cterm sorting domain-containing protein [Anaeramoeba ignava]|uniref:Pep-cterm sorting domain-containing protein n=1 Tax=Anaeramoeba ignava TaxID=1746090 RepID=A0A9Q0RA95_ANAIG|nr:pep-cterm sorting domain-containing protein [Anaeramoeba ignava]
MKKGFSAKRDGFDSQNWHSICDNKGKTLVIIKTKQNFIFGGFTSVGWTNDKSKWREDDRIIFRSVGFISDSNAFIFSLRNDKNDRKSEKFTIKKGKEEFAIYYGLEEGPTFGKYGDGDAEFCFYDSLQGYYSNFGYCYNLPKGIKWNTNESKDYLAGSYDDWIVDELETYFI